MPTPLKSALRVPNYVVFVSWYVLVLGSNGELFSVSKVRS